MKQYILDYKGFYLNRELIVKELAYYCLESDVTKVYRFKPKINFVDLTELYFTSDCILLPCCSSGIALHGSKYLTV